MHPFISSNALCLTLQVLFPVVLSSAVPGGPAFVASCVCCSGVTGPSRKPTACGVRIPIGDGSQCRKRKGGGLDRGEGRLPGRPPQDTANLGGPFGVLYPHAAMLGQRDRKAGPEGAANQRLPTALQSRAARPPRARSAGMLGAVRLHFSCNR